MRIIVNKKNLLRDKRVRDKLTDEEIAEYSKLLTTDLILNLNK